MVLGAEACFGDSYIQACVASANDLFVSHKFVLITAVCLCGSKQSLRIFWAYAAGGSENAAG